MHRHVHDYVSFAAGKSGSNNAFQAGMLHLLLPDGLYKIRLRQKFYCGTLSFILTDFNVLNMDPKSHVLVRIQCAHSEMAQSRYFDFRFLDTLT